jgi:hypothetical protein
MSNGMEPETNLSTVYSPVALYFEESDSIEYVRRDTACVYRRVDELLTQILDMQSRQLIGFRLKGFKNFYIRELMPKKELLKIDFLLAVSVVEKAMELYCNKYFDKADEERMKAYRAVWEMAEQDGVKLGDLPEAA